MQHMQWPSKAWPQSLGIALMLIPHSVAGGTAAFTSEESFRAGEEEEEEEAGYLNILKSHIQPVHDDDLLAFGWRRAAFRNGYDGHPLTSFTYCLGIRAIWYWRLSP